VDRVSKMVPAQFVSRMISAYREGRAKRGEAVSPFDIYSAIDTDMRFRMAAVRSMEGQCKISQPVYNYLFGWQSPQMNGWLGSCHALEIGFVFDKLEPAFYGCGPEAEKLSRIMQEAWTAFARTGNPSTSGLAWPQYCKERQTLLLDKNVRAEKAIFAAETQLWDEIGLYL
jgi:para-nitrobenzyl esterase